MREIHVSEITHVVRDLFMEANFDLGQDVLDAFDQGIQTEASQVATEILQELKENARIAREQRSPLCQDTGLAVLFIALGQDVHLVGGDFTEAVNAGVRQGYAEGYLRKSVCNPFTRINTRDNTPAIIHLEIVPGDRIKITAVPKGGGAENMSCVQMFSPAEGIEGIKNSIVNRLRDAGSNPCPPTVVGVGIGGTFERSAFLAKRALLRDIGQRHPDPEIAEMERDVLNRINRLGIGPMGYGGTTTALDVFFEVEPCHIASLPVAINVQCHAARHKTAVL